MRYLIAAALLATAVLLGWPAAAEPPSCASLGGSVEAGQMCRVHATGPNYMLTMTFPTDYPDQQALTDYITQNRDGFVNVAQSSGGATSRTSWRPPPTSTAPVSRRTTPAAWCSSSSRTSGNAVVDLVQGVQLQPRDEAAHHLRHPVPAGDDAAGRHLPDRAARPGTSNPFGRRDFAVDGP